ncbi:MAG: SDR family oxidoreductase [marine benthic group bacterium]|jgi:short-subunit dehydrogenase|nr:SDR family oxidoreductase [Gemmatimonadota bacterium]MCL7965216.1 SDR family oxidoreductase [Gemmatimonadota bacterium]MCL7968768.1 SDR family oxidoreductase [Gemmatimonadota bacterium]MCL7973906.1 SDR family oxidoreductase [Gemmatimonadota bacterium]MCL7976545.1 SDR family oxidoreductase [Gemmatimonadota bacterium]
MVSRDRESRGGVLITGASAGIGLELARRAAADGWDLALTARNLAALEAVAGDVGQKHGVRTVVVPADLADLTGPARVQEELHRADFAVDFLVNNAGFGTWGPFVEQSLESQLSMLQVNAVALTELTHRFLAGMRERGRGRILNVASTAAFQPGPDMAVYFASKAYVLHFSEALAHELRGTGITVTTLCPGPTETEFQDRAGMTDTRVGANPLMMDVGPVAEAGYQAAMVGRSIAVPGVANRVGSLLPRFIPRRLVRAATAFINSPR